MAAYKGDVRLLFPTMYLSAADLAGKEVTLTIRALQIDELDVKGGKEERPVLYFEETAAKARETRKQEKRLILNKTNAKTIASMYGNKAEGWTGKAITLYPTETEAFGERVDCVRVRPTAPKPAAKEA